MKINYQLSQDEYLEALKLHEKRGFKRIMIGVYSAFALVVILVSTDFSNTREIITNALLLFFTLSFYLLLTKIIGTYQSKKLYEKSTTLSNEVTLRVTGRGIKVNDQSASIPWDTFRKYKEDDKYYILYSSIRNFKIIPKKGMTTTEQKEFSTYLDKYIHKM